MWQTNGIQCVRIKLYLAVADLGEGLSSPPFFNQKQSYKAEVLKTEGGGCFPLTPRVSSAFVSFLFVHRLPIDGPSGESLYAEAAVAGKKKDAVLECALEACRMLDASGLLRQSSHGNYNGVVAD